MRFLPKTKKDWLWLAFGLTPGTIAMFAMAFDPGICNPEFGPLNFWLLIGTGSGLSIAIVGCLVKSFRL